MGDNNLVIRVENLHKSFANNIVLTGIDLEIKKGEMLCIVGSSGCGKSILVRHFNGIQEPDKGRVYVYGKDLSEIPLEELDEIKKKIGYVFQNGALFNSLSVYDNVASLIRTDPFSSLKSDNEEEIGSRVRECIGYVGLGKNYDEIKNLVPAELSGGMRKRIAVARTLAPNPPIIIYDEPTTGLDPMFVGIISDLMVQLNKEYSTTTIAVTHAIKTMKILNGRIVMLHSGEIPGKQSEPFLYGSSIRFQGTFDEFFHSTDHVINRYLDKREGVRN